jgi:hypothetical protein
MGKMGNFDGFVNCCCFWPVLQGLSAPIRWLSRAFADPNLITCLCGTIVPLHRMPEHVGPG